MWEIRLREIPAWIARRPMEIDMDYAYEIREIMEVVHRHCRYTEGEYSKEFNNALKKAVKERDHYECFMCHKKSIKLDVHHVDYNRFNCNMDNLISLCTSCHPKTKGYYATHLCLMRQVLQKEMVSKGLIKLKHFVPTQAGLKEKLDIYLPLWLEESTGEMLERIRNYKDMIDKIKKGIAPKKQIIYEDTTRSTRPPSPPS